MKAPDPIETQRLILRKPRREDAERIFTRYASDPDVTRLLGWARHQSVEATHAFLEFSDREWSRWPAGPYLVESRETGELLGGTGFAFENSQCAATGYVLAKDAWGMGYATEALRAVVEIARGVGVTRLYALCHPENPASVRVLEKCGFAREAVLPKHSKFPNLGMDDACDVFCHALAVV